MEGFNINTITQGIGFNKLDKFYDLRNRTLFKKPEICFTRSLRFFINLFLINKAFSFQKTTTKSGLSENYRLIFKILKADLARLKPKTNNYKTYKS